MLDLQIIVFYVPCANNDVKIANPDKPFERHLAKLDQIIVALRQNRSDIE